MKENVLEIIGRKIKETEEYANELHVKSNQLFSYRLLREIEQEIKQLEQ